MSEFEKLERLCGLTPNELADVLENNPRAYMAVKGAVAEKHLENYFIQLRSEGLISDYREANSDFEKDFYVTLSGGREIIVECKNVEVLKTNTKALQVKYLRHIHETHGIFSDSEMLSIESLKGAELKKMFNGLPQNLRESGLPRYQFSASLIKANSIKEIEKSTDFLTQFDEFPLSIDFQRTRNSTDDKESKEDAKAARFYKHDEIDVVAACLFSRTLNWEFVFGNRSSLIKHKKHSGRYTNGLKIKPSRWKYSFLDVVSQ